MPPAHLWLSFVLASVVLCAIPGPSLLFTIGRALAEGTIRHRRDAEAVLATLEAPGAARDWFARSRRRLARMSATGGILMILLGLSLLLTGRPPTPVARTL